MFAPILNWVLGPGRSWEKPGPVTALAESITTSPRRREILVEISDLLIGIPKEDRPDLVDQAAHRLALYVVDLPGSEKHHHREPYGLLDHSLEVARAATRELVRPSFRVSEDPAANYREQPIWAYSGFVLGLLHDVGKVLDLEVVLPGGTSAWNPLSEPLSSYLAREGRKSSGSETWRWTKGRGLNGHVWKTEALTPLVLPLRSRDYLGHRLPQLLRVFSEAYKGGKEDWRHGPAGRVVASVRDADQAHVDADRRSKDAQEEPPQASYVSPAGDAVATPPDSKALENAPHTDLRRPPPVIQAGEDMKPSGPPSRLGADHGHPESPKRSVPEDRAKMEDPGGGASAITSRKVPERDRRIDVELQPARLVESIQSWVRSGNFARNSSRGELIVRQDHLWLRYPDAFISLLHGNGISWSTKVAERLLSVLLKLPLVEPENPRSALVYAFLEPRDERPTTFVRLRSRGLLPENELAGLGFWPYEVRVQPTAIPRQQELPFRQIQGGRS